MNYPLRINIANVEIKFMVTIGILALQGGYSSHQRAFAKLGCNTRLITKPEHLVDIDALVIPGGESSTIIKLLTEDMKNHILNLHKNNIPILGTCAGSILLSKIVEPEQFSFGLVDVTVKRNAYGRQLDSFVAEVDIQLPNDTKTATIEAVFIRAPKFYNLGSEAKILSSYQGDPILIQEKNVILATFHPELTSSTILHKALVSMCIARKEAIY